MSHLSHKLLTLRNLASDLVVDRPVPVTVSSMFWVPFDSEANTTQWHLDFFCNFSVGKTYIFMMVCLFRCWMQYNTVQLMLTRGWYHSVVPIFINSTYQYECITFAVLKFILNSTNCHILNIHQILENKVWNLCWLTYFSTSFFF